MANVEDFEPGQADATQRASMGKTAPIIILFHKKSDLQNFYKQKKKLYSLNVNQFVDGFPEKGEDPRVKKV